MMLQISRCARVGFNVLEGSVPNQNGIPMSKKCSSPGCSGWAFQAGLCRLHSKPDKTAGVSHTPAAKAARDADAAAAAAVTCGACGDKICNVADCMQCSEGHAVCKECFALQITSQTRGDVRDEFIQKGCNITCAFCSRSFRDRDVMNLVPDAFQLLTRARDEVTEVRTEQRLRADFESRMERLRQELARGQEAHQQNVSRHRLHIAEHILTLKCPRAQCRKAFLDYTGCMALTCWCCGCNFCAWCLQDCADAPDAHAHVKQCPRSLQRGSYGGTHEEFQAVHRNRVRPLVLQYLAGIPQSELADVSLNVN
jgi:hypothetical protein